MAAGFSCCSLFEQRIVICEPTPKQITPYYTHFWASVRSLLNIFLHYDVSFLYYISTLKPFLSQAELRTHLHFIPISCHFSWFDKVINKGYTEKVKSGRALKSNSFKLPERVAVESLPEPMNFLPHPVPIAVQPRRRNTTFLAYNVKPENQTWCADSSQLENVLLWSLSMILDI